MHANWFTGFCSKHPDEKKDTTKKSQRGNTYWWGIPHQTKFNQNWHLSRGWWCNQSHQVW